VDYTRLQAGSLQNYEIGIKVKDQQMHITYSDNEITQERIRKMKKRFNFLMRKYEI